ncbi:MAG: hypothetical protein H7146_05720 [Burkholderiaceae bacterium]|nr:hypothetical protein [Microbacteriaceae bacterium]
MIPTSAVTGPEFPAEVAGWIGIAFWLVLGTAIVVRVVRAVVQRRRGDIARGVLEPIIRSGAVQSEAFGWPPAEDLAPVSVSVSNSSERSRTGELKESSQSARTPCPAPAPDAPV